MSVRPGKDTAAGTGQPRKSALEAELQAESRRLHALLLPAVEEQGLFLEDVEIKIAGSHRTVNVVVDLPQEQAGSVGLDLISEVSQSLSAVMDADPHDDGRPYSLEVSSPGVFRPLLEPRHWRRNIGRLVTVKPVHGEDLTGRLLDVHDDGVTVRPHLPVKKGMKPKHGDPQNFPFTKIRRGTVQVEFAHLEDGIDDDAESLPANPRNEA